MLNVRPSRGIVLHLGYLIVLAFAFGSPVAAAESSKTRGKSCQEIGELFGFGAGKAMLGLPVAPNDDVAVPDRCKDYPRLEDAIRIGLIRVQRLKK
jgi:hypothetical protein